MTDNQKQFVIELRDLLAKYRVCISSTLEGDTYGIYNEAIEFEMEAPQEKNRYQKWETFLRISDTSVTDKDL